MLLSPFPPRCSPVPACSSLKGGESTGIRTKQRLLQAFEQRAFAQSLQAHGPASGSAALEIQGPPRFWEDARSASLGLCPGLTRRALPKAGQPRNHQPPRRTAGAACQGRERPGPHQLVGSEAAGHWGQAWGTGEGAWERLSMKTVLAQEHWP